MKFAPLFFSAKAKADAQLRMAVEKKRQQQRATAQEQLKRLNEQMYGRNVYGNVQQRSLLMANGKFEWHPL